MKRKFAFVLGACIIIGMVDLATEQVVFATVYNPLNPQEEIIPKDHQEETEGTTETETVEPEEKTVAVEEPKEKIQEDQHPVTDRTHHFLLTGNYHTKRVTVEDVFLANELAVDLEKSDDKLDGNGNDKPSYLTSLCYFFSGNVLYGQKSDGGLKTHVFDIFE